MKRILFSFILVNLLCLPVIAEIPSQLNFQTRLLQLDKTPVADGTYDVQFNLYNVDTGGSPLWQDTYSVTTTNGYFSVVLGAGAQDLSGVDFSQQLYVGIKVGADSQMTPRIVLVSVPYAVQVSKAAHTEIATHATTATSATSASNATSATSATEATNALNLGGRVASGYLTTENNSVKTNHITNGAVTQSKFPSAPMLYISNSQEDSVKIVAGQGVTGAAGDVTISLSGFTQVPVVVITAINEDLFDNVYIHKNSIDSFRVKATTVDPFPGPTVPLDITFHWMAVGEGL